MRDTIFALSSGQAPSAIAIIRVSGTRASSALEGLAGRIPSPRRASLATLRHPISGLVLDHGLAIYFPGPNTATGEDLAEFHLHGGRAVIAAVQAALGEIEGLRPALAGEFTRRAFQNGRLDLAEAEGLADLLTAETESQRRNAMALADGALSRKVRHWRETLLRMAAELEARIDFSDEDDVPDDDGVSRAELAVVAQEIESLLAAPPAERLRDGIRVVLGGPPNSGKSSLFNILVGREAAIATPVPGTTRDLIEYSVQLRGTPFVFIDTAGLRDAEDEIERIGVDRARGALAQADIVVWLGDTDNAPDGAIRLNPRCDIPGREHGSEADQISVSVKSGEGIEALIGALVSRGTSLLPREDEIALAARQRGALAECLAALGIVDRTPDILIVAEALRAARAALDQLTGEGGVEPLLDALFGKFCIGK